MRTILITFLLLAFISAPALAELRKDIAPRYSSVVNDLSRINAERPEQSRYHKHAKKILGSRVLDKTNRVVGKVNNIILDRSGGIAMMDVNFNRMRLDQDSLIIDYSIMNARPATNGYKLGNTDDQIEAMLPEILNDMATASGERSNTHSLKKLLGRSLYDQDNNKIARIENVLFNSTGSRAEYLFIEMKDGSVRGEKFAIPFAVMRMKKNRLYVSNKYAESMVHYAKLN